MLVYKDRSERARGLPERSSQTLERICGLEPGLPYEGLAHTLAVVCLPQAVMLGFDSREAMCAWDARVRCALGEGEWHRARGRAGCPGAPPTGAAEAVTRPQASLGVCSAPWPPGPGPELREGLQSRSARLGGGRGMLGPSQPP